jgi:hypothetical protein
MAADLPVRASLGPGPRTGSLEREHRHSRVGVDRRPTLFLFGLDTSSKPTKPHLAAFGARSRIGWFVASPPDEAVFDRHLRAYNEQPTPFAEILASVARFCHRIWDSRHLGPRVSFLTDGLGPKETLIL